MQEAIKVEDLQVQLQFCSHPLTLSLWFVDGRIKLVTNVKVVIRTFSFGFNFLVENAHKR